MDSVEQHKDEVFDKKVLMSCVDGDIESPRGSCEAFSGGVPELLVRDPEGRHESRPHGTGVRSAHAEGLDS